MKGDVAAASARARRPQAPAPRSPRGPAAVAAAAAATDAGAAAPPQGDAAGSDAARVAPGGKLFSQPFRVPLVRGVRAQCVCVCVCVARVCVSCVCACVCVCVCVCLCLCVCVCACVPALASCIARVPSDGVRRTDTGAEGAWQAPLDALRLVDGMRALRGPGAPTPVATLVAPPGRHAGGVPPALEFYTKASARARARTKGRGRRRRVSVGAPRAGGQPAAAGAGGRCAPAPPQPQLPPDQLGRCRHR